MGEGLEPRPAYLPTYSPFTQCPCSATSFLDSQACLSPQKQRLEGLVWQPVCSLVKALGGPQNLIKKRLDKLLDFERLEEKQLEEDSMTYEEKEAWHTYQALNSLLVAELPQFNQLAMRWLSQILRTFMTLQRDFAKQVLQRTEGSLAQVRPLGLGQLWGSSQVRPRSPFTSLSAGVVMGVGPSE